MGAELSSASLQIFDPQVPRVRKGVGEVVRLHTKIKPGISNALNGFAVALESEDIYSLVRFLAFAGALGGLISTVALGLNEVNMQEEASSLGSPLRDAGRIFSKFWKLLRQGRVWFLFILCLLFCAANKQAVSKFLRRSSTLVLVKGLAQLARVTAVSNVAFGTSGSAATPSTGSSPLPL